jgi:hypothetical protein
MLCKNHKLPAKILLVAAFSLLLGACGQDNASVSATTGTATDTATVSTTTTSTQTAAATTGAFSLFWTAPVSRTDGSPLALSEIAGYRVHYGKSQGNYTNHVNINNGSLQSATLTGIPVGTYYVVMSTYDASGIESSYSAPVIKQAF